MKLDSFDINKFKKLIETYDFVEEGKGKADFEDVLYLLGFCVDDKFKNAPGYYSFLSRLRDFISKETLLRFENNK
tara:strand:+ start:256 stop:480 length:225 start_codon:yes stop_codon:yes gene_type:complete